MRLGFDLNVAGNARINEASLGNTHDVYEDVDDGFDNVVVHE